MKYPAKITTEDKEGNYLVEFIDLEEAFTEGKTLEEALFNAAEVLTLCLEYRIAKKQDVPNTSKIEGDNIYMIGVF